jgi:hypothetical protein
VRVLAPGETLALDAPYDSGCATGAGDAASSRYVLLLVGLRLELRDVVVTRPRRCRSRPWSPS